MSELLLLNYENQRSLGVLTEGEGGPHLKVVPPFNRHNGSWLNGWFRGRRNFFALYYTGGAMRVAVRGETCDLHPDQRLETITWRGDGPRAELAIERGGEELLRYRYLRRLRWVIEDEEFPEHDLPQWLHRMWSNPEADFGDEVRREGLHRI